VQRAATAAALADAQANLIWSRLEFTTDELQPHEVDALWDLATAEPATRDAFLEQLAENHQLVLRFARFPDPVLRAFGLRLGAEQAAAALGPALDAFRATAFPTTTDTRVLDAVRALAPQLGAEQARAALGRVLDAFKGTTDDLFAPWAGAVQALAPKLSAEQAQAALAPVLEVLEAPVDPAAMQALAQAVATLPGLAPNLGTTWIASMLRIARSGLGSTASAEKTIAWAGVLEGLLFAWSKDDYVEKIVELLKYPTAALRWQDVLDDKPSSATEYLLGKLRERFPGVQELQGGSLEDVLAWVAENYPEVNLASLPKRPAPLAEVAASLPLPR
jgi:hypothetical protein